MLLEADPGMRRVAASLAVAGLLSGCVGSSETTPLITAVGSGTTADVKRVLDSGAKVNEKDYANSTALFSAARRGGLEKLNLLLDGGADIKQQGTGRYTVLMAAAAGQLGVDVVHRLLDAGADPCVRATGQHSSWRTVGEKLVSAEGDLGGPDMYYSTSRECTVMTPEYASGGAKVRS